MPDDPTPAARAYLDWRAFGVLPGAGGALDQPAHLMDGMRHIHEIVAVAEAARAERERRSRKR